jgi:hypothetical protein
LLHVNKDDGIDNNFEDDVYIRLATKGLQSFSENNKRKANHGVIVTTTSIIICSMLVLLMLLITWRNKFKCCGVPSHDSQGSAGIAIFR